MPAKPKFEPRKLMEKAMNAGTTILPSILPFWQDMERSVDIFPDIVSGERRNTVLGNPDI